MAGPASDRKDATLSLTTWKEYDGEIDETSSDGLSEKELDERNTHGGIVFTWLDAIMHKKNFCIAHKHLLGILSKTTYCVQISHEVGPTQNFNWISLAANPKRTTVGGLMALEIMTRRQVWEHIAEQTHIDPDSLKRMLGIHEQSNQMDIIISKISNFEAKSNSPVSLKAEFWTPLPNFTPADVKNAEKWRRLPLHEGQILRVSDEGLQISPTEIAFTNDDAAVNSAAFRRNMWWDPGEARQEVAPFLTKDGLFYDFPSWPLTTKVATSWHQHVLLHKFESRVEKAVLHVLQTDPQYTVLPQEMTEILRTDSEGNVEHIRVPCPVIEGMLDLLDSTLAAKRGMVNSQQFRLVIKEVNAASEGIPGGPGQQTKGAPGDLALWRHELLLGGAVKPVREYNARVNARYRLSFRVLVSRKTNTSDAMRLMNKRSKTSRFHFPVHLT